MARRPTVAVLGGTFDRIHAGHRALLDAAFSNSDRVGIGLTTDRFLAEHPKPLGERIRSYTERRRSLERLLATRYPRRRYTVVPLHDAFGGSLRPGVDRIVVSEETLTGAREVNRLRRRLGLPRLEIIIVPTVVGEDRQPIAGRRIRAGEIDRTGRRRTPMVVQVSLDDPASLHGVRQAVSLAFPTLSFTWRPRHTARSSGGRGSRTMALRRAGAAARGGDLGLALVGRWPGPALFAAATPVGPIGAIRIPIGTEPGSVRRLARFLRAPATPAH